MSALRQGIETGAGRLFRPAGYPGSRPALEIVRNGGGRGGPFSCIADR